MNEQIIVTMVSENGDSTSYHQINKEAVLEKIAEHVGRALYESQQRELVDLKQRLTNLEGIIDKIAEPLIKACHTCDCYE